MSNLVTINGNKIEEAEPLPEEFEFEIVLNDANETRLVATGVLVITQAFVGIGNNKQSEIRAIAPFNMLKYVQRTSGKTSIGIYQGNA